MYKILVLLGLCHVSLAWMEAPYTTDSFNKREEYGTNITLQCEDSRSPPSNTFQYWITPDLTVMKGGDSMPFYTIDGESTWRVSTSGNALYISNLIQNQFGFYYCVMKSAGEEFVIKKAINYDGPHFGNRWDHYKMNVIIGLCAAGVFLILAIVFAIIVSYCGEKVPEKETEKEKTEPEVVVSNSDQNGAPVAELGYHMNLKRRDVPSQAGYDNENNYEEARL